MIWKNLRLGRKLGTAFGTVLILLCAVVWIYHSTVSNVEQGHAELLATEMRIHEYAVQVQLLMSHCRRNEKDFLLRKDEEYFDKFNGYYVELISNAQAIAPLARKAGLEKTGKRAQDVVALAESYRQAFRQVVDGWEAMGLDYDRGLQGECRSAAHELADAAKEHDVDSLLTDVLMLRRQEKDYLLRGDEKYVGMFQNAMQAMRDSVADLEFDEEGHDAMVARLDGYERAFTRLVAKRNEIERLIAEMRTLAHRVDAASDEIDGSVMAALESKTAALTSSAARRATVSLWIGAAAVFTGIFLAVVISGGIVGPVRKAVEFASAVAGGDLTQRVHIDRADEIGDLNVALNRMAGNLTEIVDQISTASAKMEAAAKEQAVGATNQSTATAEMSTTASELLTTAQQVARSGTSVSEQASTAADECAGGVKSVQGAVQGITGIRERVEKIAEHMVNLGGKSQQISGVLDIINELAEQTNLLSLNASIEAAGAGDAGKRFAVVASEIRKLAERAGESTTEIRGLIDSIQQTVNATIMATEEGTKAVQMGVRLTKGTEGTFERIASQVASTRESAQAIEMASRQQATALEQLDCAVRNIDTTAQQANTASCQVQREAQGLAEAARRFKTGRS